MDDSTITCGEIIEETVPTNLNEKKANLKNKICVLYLHFY